MSAIYAKIRVLAYSSVDWDFRPEGYHPSSFIGVDTPKHTDRCDEQANIRPKDTTKVKLEELPGSISIRVKRKTTKKREAQAVVSPVIFSTSNITYWWDELTKRAPSYLPNYLPYRTKASGASKVREWVMQQAEKPLTLRELKAGYLYVYWNKATFGVYKIGYTTLDVSTRLRRWEAQCKHTAQEQYRSPFKVRNVKRLERLVHAELKEYRVEEHGCHGCSKNHKEWFKGVDFKIIRESIAFWTKWIIKEQGQYEEIESEWVLKEDARNELSQLCTRLSVAKAEESKEKSITITPPRHNARPRVAKRPSSYKGRGNW